MSYIEVHQQNCGNDTAIVSKDSYKFLVTTKKPGNRISIRERSFLILDTKVNRHLEMMNHLSGMKIAWDILVSFHRSMSCTKTSGWG